MLKSGQGGGPGGKISQTSAKAGQGGSTGAPSPLREKGEVNKEIFGSRGKLKKSCWEGTQKGSRDGQSGEKGVIKNLKTKASKKKGFATKRRDVMEIEKG